MKLKLLTILSIVFICSQSYELSGQKSRNNYLVFAEKIFDELVDIRNDLHNNPELAENEKRTSKIVKDYLLNLGLEVKTGFGGYGVVGILRGNNSKGKKIAWRADMDAALHVFDQKLNAKPQVAHICGHDVHTVIGLGIANVLSKMKDKIGTVYFIFQPAEESFKGAKSMIENGLFKEIKPNEIFGLHVYPTEIGTVSSKPYELFAYQRKIKLTFDSAIDQEAFNNFFQEVLEGFVRHKKNSEPWSLDHLTDPQIGLSNPNTIYDDYYILGSNISVRREENTTSFECTYYETDATELDSISKQITNSVLNSEYGKFYINTSFTADRPTVVNDPKLTNQSLILLKDLYGEENVNRLYGQVPYSNEDFIYYQYEVPGVMFLIGASNKEKGIYAMPHTSAFEVDEEVIKIGVNYFSTFLIQKINSNKS